MKISYQLSNLAKRDLENIWLYTSKKWSADQANLYYNILVSEIEFICQNPEIGRSIDQIKTSHVYWCSSLTRLRTANLINH